MKVLIIGRGGREHAFACSCINSKLVDEVYVAPGNGGISREFEVVNIDECDVEKLALFAKEKGIDLTIVGPESSLSSGIVDTFLQYDLKIFGPTKKATMIESSKEFAKSIMKKYNIPTAKYEVFDNYYEAIRYVEREGVPIVIKYDGLASGKGVVVANDMNKVKETLELMLVQKVYGNEKVIIEEFLEGEEFSLMAMVNGKEVYELELSQDHKQLLDGDLGPNTGGMGAYSPVDIVDKESVVYAVNNIMKKVADAMVLEGSTFTGFLYGGLILTVDGVKVIEFNARFGDPEAEVVLPRLESDFVENILDVLDGKVPNIKWNEDYIVGVVMASSGYPNQYEKNHLILGDLSGVYHMGTSYDNGYRNSGGRVLLVKGRGSDLDEAIYNAYLKVDKIKCNNLTYRSDIGKRKRNDI